MKIKDMLYVIMQKIKKPTSFTLEATSGLTTTGQCFFYSSENRVRLDVYVTSSNPITTSTVLSTIPEDYRPSSAKAMGAVVITTANVAVPITVTVGTNGQIKQGSTNTGKTIMIHGSYYL